jgi:hypothetical protein
VNCGLRIFFCDKEEIWYHVNWRTRYCAYLSTVAVPVREGVLLIEKTNEL